MDVFEVYITHIYSVVIGKHVVLVDCDTDCYGKTEHNKVCFLKQSWERIKNTKQYLETEGWDDSSFQYYESLSDEEFHQRFERTLKEFTDEELAEEINKRAANKLFNHIGFEVKAVVTKK